jgi:hypothetical protein
LARNPCALFYLDQLFQKPSQQNAMFNFVGHGRDHRSLAAIKSLYDSRQN